MAIFVKLYERALQTSTLGLERRNTEYGSQILRQVISTLILGEMALQSYCNPFSILLNFQFARLSCCSVVDWT
jgi:hypothetical protein